MDQHFPVYAHADPVKETQLQSNTVVILQVQTLIFPAGITE